MISGDPEVIYLFNYPQQSSAFPLHIDLTRGLVLAASLSLPSRVALETFSRFTARHRWNETSVLAVQKHARCQHFFCPFRLRIPHCCLIPAGLKWHKLGDSFDISDVPLTHQLCVLTLNFLTLTVSFRGDSEEIVKLCRASIQQSVRICSFGSGDDIFRGDWLWPKEPNVSGLNKNNKGREERETRLNRWRDCATWTRRLPTDALALWTKEEENARDE